MHMTGTNCIFTSGRQMSSPKLDRLNTRRNFESVNMYDSGQATGTATEKALAARISGVSFNILSNTKREEYFTDLRRDSQGEAFRAPFWSSKKAVDVPYKGSERMKDSLRTPYEVVFDATATKESVIRSPSRAKPQSTSPPGGMYITAPAGASWLSPPRAEAQGVTTQQFNTLLQATLSPQKAGSTSSRRSRSSSHHTSSSRHTADVLLAAASTYNNNSPTKSPSRLLAGADGLRGAVGSPKATFDDASSVYSRSSTKTGSSSPHRIHKLQGDVSSPSRFQPGAPIATLPPMPVSPAKGASLTFAQASYSPHKLYLAQHQGGSSSSPAHRLELGNMVVTKTNDHYGRHCKLTRDDTHYNKGPVVSHTGADKGLSSQLSVPYDPITNVRR